MLTALVCSKREAPLDTNATGERTMPIDDVADDLEELTWIKFVSGRTRRIARRARDEILSLRRELAQAQSQLAQAQRGQERLVVIGALALGPASPENGNEADRRGDQKEVQGLLDIATKGTMMHEAVSVTARLADP